MSRDGGHGRIDSLKTSLNHEQYYRSGLGNAVRFNAALNTASNMEDDPNSSFNKLDGRVTQDEFANALESDLNAMADEFDNAMEEELGSPRSKIDTEETVQQRLANRAYRTNLGRSVAGATVENTGMFQDANSPFSSGATGAFRSFTNGFVQDDKDAFGSRVLYDNVFGNYEDGGESLTMKRRLTITDPTNHANRTVGDKMLDDVVNRSIYDQSEIIRRVDTEFARFHGDSMIDQLSMTGSGLQAARETIRTVMLESSAYGRQVGDRADGTHPVEFAQAMMDRVGQENITAEIEDVKNSLTLLDNNLKNRSGQSVGVDGGYVNKAGVAQFIDLINTAGTRTEAGDITGGHISISSFQFQNETISAALTDKIQRHVLESVLQGGTAKPLQVDLTLAYPRQRALNEKNSDDTRYGVGGTNYGILGPNLIEAMKLEEVKNDVFDMLRGMGVVEEDLHQYLRVNIQFRDKKFHPKVYLTDNVAGIGTQNLTGPVGNSVNQAGSNFETMRFVTNKYKDDVQLEQARAGFVPLSRAHGREDADNAMKNGDITQTLLYRQIVSAVEQEQNYTNKSGVDRAGGNTSAPIINSRRGQQIGFAGDIYEHLRNTLNYAYESNFNVINGPQKGSLRKEVANQNSTHMFMVLDQAFMLQLGSNQFAKQLKGEMGAEIGSPFGERSDAASQYRVQQNRLFDLLIANKASVVVDTKNYQEQIMNPLIEKINKNEALKSNFERHGKSLGLMAGYDLFDPGSSATPEEYSLSMKAMRKELVRLGFTKEAGFDDTDIKQLIGLASGNIEMAKAPRQHVKSFGLMDYRNAGSPELISYYMGSSNLGLYSLGIPTGSDGGYRDNDGDLTNTEMGLMLGRRDLNDGTNLSRVQDVSQRMSQGQMSDPTDINGIQRVDSSSMDQWSLTQEEERHELMLAQRHLVHTWSQLGNSSMMNPNFTEVKTTPLWQSNVNTGDLEILKNRLETMAKDLGIDPHASRSAFQIVERYGDVSGSGVTSINVTIDMAQMLGSKGFLPATASLPKLNFELTVLQGPSRGSGMFNDRTQDGNVPGFVYFVDKNKVVGNGLFSNDSGKAIQILGRHNYGDDFISDIKNGGRITLESGQSAEMSSLDMVPQMFGTLIGEGIKRFGTSASADTLRNIKSIEEQRDILADFASKMLSGRGDQVIEGPDGSSILTARELIQQDINATSVQDLMSRININAASFEGRADFREEGDSFKTRQDNRNDLIGAVKVFNSELNNIFAREGRDINQPATQDDVELLITSLHKFAFGDASNNYRGSDQLANIIMKTSGRDPQAAQKMQDFKEYQNLMFGSFLQSRDDRTYGGQQGFYRTLLLGVGDSTVDKETAGLMFELDEENAGIHNAGAYARFKALEYRPTTDVHQILYRSVASKSSSMSKNSPGLDSLLMESEARDMGDAANLRLMSSIGIGRVTHRDEYIVKDASGNVQVGEAQQRIFDAMKSANVSDEVIDRARQAYIQAAQDRFGEGDSRRDTVRLEFFTGSAKKLSQLPQRIKNAMGARPLYQYSVEAQMALAQGDSLNEITEGYVRRNRDPLKESIKRKIASLQDELDVLNRSGTKEEIERVSNRLEDLKTIGVKAFSSEVDGLGAVFSGQIKSVLNQEQVSFISKTKQRMYEAMEDLIKEGEVSEEQFNELIRVEVMKAGLTNKGLGKMIAGSNHMNYSMSIVQLTGTYNDTFLANTLYGTTYKNKQSYDNIRKIDGDIYSMNQEQLHNAGVLNVGMTEGYFETQQKSIKGSMMGEGGIDVLMQAGDIIVEDPDTGYFVQKRKVDGSWKIVGAVDDNRNLQTVSNIIDNTAFSDVGSPTLGSAPTTSYGRRGEDSVEYIYSVNSRPGNFRNNEYLLQFNRLRSIKAGSGRRVEGTDSSSLVKGVAFFAGRITKEIDGEQRTLNLFEDIERQYLESYNSEELGGSLKAYLDYSSQTQYVNANGDKVYAPLSSSIQGVFNANNFKSFFWSHGSTILKSQTETSEGRSHFMLDELFSTQSNNNVTNAKKLAGALLLNFGTEFIAVNSTDAETRSTEVNKIKRILVDAMLKGEYGDHYRKLAISTGLQLKTGDVKQINEQADALGRSRADITSELLFDKISKNSGYNGLTLGGIAGISSDQLNAVLSGDQGEATKLLDRVRKGMLDPVAKEASSIGGINFDNHTHLGAALVTTAVDLMHQLSRSGSKLQLPSDIDIENDKVKEILFTAMGLGGSADEEYKEDIIQFVNALNTDVSAVSVFTDITFSFSKDPVGTQSVGRHEAQHLITPFTGDLEKYRKGGQLDKIQHTVAGLQALLTGRKSGLVFYDQLDRVGFNEKKALNLASAETDFMFSTLHKQNFLGFYQQGTSGIATDNLVKSYKDINEELARDNSKYNWESFQVVRDMGDATKIASVRDGGSVLTDLTGVNAATDLVNKHIDQFYPNVDPVERARLQDKFLRMGGQAFALHQMDELVNQMSIHNARFQTDPRKTMGKDTTSQFLQNMQNKQMFVSIPNLDFTTQNGELIARTDRNNLISTIIPSADDMRVLGAQYADFVDPILGHYKNLSSIFVPGTEENRVFEKVRLATQTNQPLFLSTAEFKVYKKIQDSAILMPAELQAGIAGARTQEALAGKNKYQGFTSTAIGSLLMPFGSVALAQSKLDEAGMRRNKARLEAAKKSDSILDGMNKRLQRRFTDKESLYIALDNQFSRPTGNNPGDFHRALSSTTHFHDNISIKGLGTINSTMSSLNNLRREGFAAQRHNLSTKAQAGNIVSTLNELQRLHDQLDRIKESSLENEASRKSISDLQSQVVQYRNFVFEQGAKSFGLKAYTALDIMSQGTSAEMKEKGLGIYKENNPYVTIDGSQSDKAIAVYGVVDDTTGRIHHAGDFIGEDALPIVRIHKETVMGFMYIDEDTEEEVILQRAGFQGVYGTKGLRNYQLDNEDVDRATRRALNFNNDKEPRRTAVLQLEERRKAARVQDTVMEEMEALFPDDRLPAPFGTEEFGPKAPKKRKAKSTKQVEVYGPPLASNALSTFRDGDSSDIISLLELARTGRFNTKDDISLDNVKSISDTFQSLSTAGYRDNLRIKQIRKAEDRRLVPGLGWGDSSNPFLNAITSTDIPEEEVIKKVISEVSQLEKTSMEALEIARNLKPDFISGMNEQYLEFYTKAAKEKGLDGDSLRNDLDFLHNFEANYKKQYQDNDNDIAGLLRYTSNASYYEMNKFRRGQMGITGVVGGAMSDFDRLAVDIEKIPAFGQTTTYRGISSRIADTLTVGQVMKDAAVTSTSKNIEVGKNFAHGKGTLFVIESTSGRDLSSFSDFDNEDEILFKPNAEFEVVRIDESSENYQQIFLREIAEGGATSERSTALEIAQRANSIMAQLPSFVEPVIVEPEAGSPKELLDVERFGYIYGESNTEEFLNRVSEHKRKIKKLSRGVTKYRKKVLGEDVDVERKRRKTKEDWQYILRDALELDDSKVSGFIAKEIESRILTGSEISLPSKFAEDQSRAEDLFAKLESQDPDIIDIFKAVRLANDGSTNDMTLEESLILADTFEDIKSKSSQLAMLPAEGDDFNIERPSNISMSEDPRLKQTTFDAEVLMPLSSDVNLKDFAGKTMTTEEGSFRITSEGEWAWDENSAKFASASSNNVIGNTREAIISQIEFYETQLADPNSTEAKKRAAQKQLTGLNRRLNLVEKRLETLNIEFQSRFADEINQRYSSQIQPEVSSSQPPIKPPSNTITSIVPEPPEEPGKKVNNVSQDPTKTSGRRQEESRAEFEVRETFRTRYNAEPRVQQEHASLVDNLRSFHRKQKAAIMLGVSKGLEQEFDVMKREAIETKNMIAAYKDSNFLTETEKQEAFQSLKAKLLEKRNAAYAMANISPDTGKEIAIDPKTGEALPGKDGFPQRRPSLNDSYIYHAQALNYDQLLTQVSLLGNTTGVEELSKEHVKDLQRRSTFIRKYGSFALNSYEDGDGASTFFGLGHQEVDFDTKTLFVIENSTPDGGTVERHMKAISEITQESKNLGMTEVSDSIAADYARKQIDSQIAMYENRAAEMRKFSNEREAHSGNRDAQGNPIIDKATNDRINTAHQEYDHNTKSIVDYLKAQKAKLSNGASKNQVRTIFEDIDVMVATTDTANLQLAEVFRPPTPGGTDPRLHTYRVMQGVMALNQVSQMLQNSDPSGKTIKTQSTKMIYSTERGQTATVMASLGIVTYGGGDWDGDSYTAIFHQASKIQSAIQKHEGKKIEAELLMKAAKDEKAKVIQELKSLNAGTPQYNEKAKRLADLDKTISDKRALVASHNEEFQNAKVEMENQIQSGYRGLNTRARKQVANYTGIDERHFVSTEDFMYDVNGKVIKDANGNAVTGLREGRTQDADALFVYMEQGYQLMEGVDSKRNQVIGMMDNIDLLTGYRKDPKAFTDEGFLNQLAMEFRNSNGNEITTEHPAMGVLKQRVAALQTGNQPLTDNQRAFLSTLEDDEASRAWLQEFDKLTTEMGMQDAETAIHGRNGIAYIKDAQERRARMNRFISEDLFNPMLANETVGKFMQQGVGMNLTEGTFDMTLKILGKAGGELLGKTYNTIISSTFQDSPVITYGTQMMDETSDLYHATLNEFQMQAERRFETHEMSPRKAEIIEDGKQKGLTGKSLDIYVNSKIREVGYDEFRSHRETTMAAVEKSGDVQGFMKNIHQLLRDSIKLKADTGDLQGELDDMSLRYDDLSNRITDSEDEGEKRKYQGERDRIIEGMASKLGPGPGLKSLVDLDFLTNEASRTGLGMSEFEERFFNGKIENDRDRLLSMGASMNLSKTEMEQLRTVDGTEGNESSALLKVARGQTARNLGAMVTSFQMARLTGDSGDRSQSLRELATTQRARLATQIEAHSVPGMPLNRTSNGQIDVSGVINNKYTQVIESEHEGARYDAHRQHKEALGSHLGLEQHQIFNEDGQLSAEYTNKLRDTAQNMGVDQDEYLLAYDHLMENNREVISGIYGNDGEKMAQFTTMNLARKNIAQSMLTGQTPSEDGKKVMDELSGPELLTTMSQLAAQGKLDTQGMEIFNGMYKGVMRQVIDATGHTMKVLDKKTGKIKEVEYHDLDEKSKSVAMTKLMYENLFATQVGEEKGFSRATSEEARGFMKGTGQVIADSVLEMDENGNLNSPLIDALDKAGEGSLTDAQKKNIETMGEEYLRETLDSEAMSEQLLKQYLKVDGVDANSPKADMYRKQVATTVRSQMKARQEQMSNSNALSRSRHNRGYGVQSRNSFVNNINSDVIGQLSKDSRANALDLVMPLLLTAAGTAISEGSINGDDIMALGGAAFTSFQYARTGTIDAADMSPSEAKKRIGIAQATSGVFKLKNAMQQHGEDNMGAAIAQVAISEAVSVGFNSVATPWLSKNIAEKAFGAGAAPAMNALDMRKYQAGHQLGGNLAASAISAVSSTLISGILMNTMQGRGPSISDTIQSFLPATQAVSQVNEAIAKRRAQEAAFEDFQAETDGTGDSIEEYMVVTDATYNPDDYSSIADLAAAQEVEPGSDGSLSVGLMG